MYVIVILAMIAGFLALRLYSVLGKRTGHEQEPAPRAADERPKVTVLQPGPMAQPGGDSVRLAEGLIAPGAETGIQPYPVGAQARCQHAAFVRQAQERRGIGRRHRGRRLRRGADQLHHVRHRLRVELR